MNRGKSKQNQTLRYKCSLLFGLTSILPLLLFLFVLRQYDLFQDYQAMAILGMSFVLAGLGFLFFMKTVTGVDRLSQDFIKMEQGEIEELGERDTSSEFTEMARIAESFNKTLTELKSHTKELESLIGQITTLSELTELVSRIPDIKEVLKIVLQRTMGAVNAKMGSIMILDDESQTLRIAASEGLDETVVAKTIIRVGENIAGKVAQTGESILVEDLDQDSRFSKVNDPKYKSSSFISMPLRAHWRVMGVLNLSKRGGTGVFSESDLKFLTTLLGHVGFALENAKLLKDAKSAAEQLQQVVSKQSVQLDVAQKEVLYSMELFQEAQRMEAMGTLAGGIAHDFNNLLMGIQGNISLVLNDIESSHPHHERLQNIEQYVLKGADLTRQLLGFARGGKYDVKIVKLSDLVEKSSKLFGRTRKEIKIQRELQEDIWPVEADPAQIEQVMLNLYVNACQAMPEGGELYLKTENLILNEDFVRPHELNPGKYVKISVSDTGIGMDEETIQRIFEPFFTTKNMGRGTGLGLASAYGIVKNHEGIINAQSKKGKGTTFNIYLPASEKEVIKEKEHFEELLEGKETILLIDDEDMIISVGSPMLKRLGYGILIARSGKEALEIYVKNKDKIDMIILDMIMPDMGGSETYDRIKEINPDIKVLLASGYSLDGQASEILKRGCNGFIQKPFKMAPLSQKIREVLDN